jgi:N-acyl-L-homoserine lactone synthetase
MQIHELRAPRALDHAAFRAMFAARKLVFIDLLKWELPVHGGEFEIDQFDSADAEYLVLLDEDGGHRASTRLLPTDRAHLLGDLYGFLCVKPVPSGPSVYEITRFCLDRRQSARERRAARNQLVTVLAEHALRHGITDYTGVADWSWFQQIERFGWRCSALGAPVRVGCQTLVALHIRIDDCTLDGLRDGGVYQPLSHRLVGTREARV